MTDSVESVLQKSREEFESVFGYGQQKPDETWVNERRQHRWEGWQASRSALEPMLAELEKFRTVTDYARCASNSGPGDLQAYIEGLWADKQAAETELEALSPSATPAQPYKPLIKSDKKHVHVDLDEFQ